MTDLQRFALRKLREAIRDLLCDKYGPTWRQYDHRTGARWQEQEEQLCAYLLDYAEGRKELTP